MAGVEARVKSEHRHRYPELIASMWYTVAPIFPGVTQRMVNMAGERLTRLSTAHGHVIVKAIHLDFRYLDDAVTADTTGTKRAGI